MAAGSWSLAEELFAREDPGFVDELRSVHFAERLGDFAPKWLADGRPFARAALFDYLSRPLDCYRHEPLVKRLFKLAEKANDDELMGAFLVALDRSVRRRRQSRPLYKQETFKERAAAEAAVRRWEAEGYENGTVNHYSGWFYASATKTEYAVALPSGTVMPRPPKSQWKKNQSLSAKEQARNERRGARLFTVSTRRYLRRRAWRYFRNIGKSDPARYLRAASLFLTRYTDADADTDFHLLDNWGLVHALFYHSPALVCPAKGWEFAPGKSIADLAAAPRFEDAWAADAPAVFAVLVGANGRAVRQWATAMLRKHHGGWLAAQPAATLLRLADSRDPELSALGFELLEKAADLDAVPIGEWLARLAGDNLDQLTRLSDLLARRLDPARVAQDDALKLAVHRSKPVAALGLSLLKRKPFTESDIPALLTLVQAESAAVRPELARWLRETLSGFGPVRPGWVLEFLDSKHADVRADGWGWLTACPAGDDAAVWHKLIESPYDDVRGPMVAELARRAAGADPDTVRQLWAVVLLNVARGGRYKPGVVGQVVSRLAAHPGEADRLVPLLAVAVRSLRGPEFRAGLAGVVQLVETRPDLEPLIRQRFPELVLV
jgi:hypothetical protein